MADKKNEKIPIEHEYKLKALTDLWTGSVIFEEKNGQIKEKISPDRLITTGLLGSIRWWFEVLVRGLGGSACDPTDTKCEGRNHCVVCELFGCTGWARKFRFEVLDCSRNIKANQIKEPDQNPQRQDEIFRLRFTPLRPIRGEEWALLDATLRLIAEYGAIGGKTVFKPTDEQGRQGEKHHQDYGIVQIESAPDLNRKRQGELKEYVSKSKWRKLNHGEFAWASLQHFWCVNERYLGRQDSEKSTFNQVLERREEKKHGQRLDTYNEITEWLAGSQQESKKVFSFKNPPRTFGFVKPKLIDFDVMKEKLQKVWGKDGWEFLTGEKIIDRLLAKGGDHS